MCVATARRFQPLTVTIAYSRAASSCGSKCSAAASYGVLHVALDVPDEAALVAHAAERSLALSGLGPFWHEPREDRQGVVLGYAAPPEHAYGQTLATLADALQAGVTRERRASHASPSAGATSSRTVASTASRR